jgi:hypothetical protein
MTDLADEKVSFLDAAILIFSPFAGWRPSRSGVAIDGIWIPESGKF